jgi:hypothetical protein
MEQSARKSAELSGRSVIGWTAILTGISIIVATTLHIKQAWAPDAIFTGAVCIAGGTAILMTRSWGMLFGAVIGFTGIALLKTPLQGFILHNPGPGAYQQIAIGAIMAVIALGIIFRCRD